jgi:hypothetical protein
LSFLFAHNAKNRGPQAAPSMYKNTEVLYKYARGFFLKVWRARYPPVRGIFPGRLNFFPFFRIARETKGRYSWIWEREIVLLRPCRPAAPGPDTGSAARL